MKDNKLKKNNKKVNKNEKKNPQIYSSDKRALKTFLVFILFVTLMIILFFAEGKMLDLQVNKAFKLSNKVNDVYNEKILFPIQYDIHGILNYRKGEKELDVNSCLNVSKNSKCTLKLDNGDKVKLNKCKRTIFNCYNSEGKNTDMVYEYNNSTLTFFSPDIVGRYKIEIILEYNYKDKLVYYTYLNVEDINENIVIDNVDTIESVAYKDMNDEKNVEMDLKIQREILYVLNKSKLVSNIVINEVPDNSIQITEKNKMLYTINIWKKNNKVYLYKSFNQKYYEVPSELVDVFTNII